MPDAQPTIAAPNSPSFTEYRVKRKTLFYVTRYERGESVGNEVPEGSVSTVGQFDSRIVANNIAEALCQRDYSKGVNTSVWTLDPIED